MKKFLNCRILPFVCALSILISLCVLPVSAAWDPDDYVDEDSVAQIQSLMSIPSGWDINVVGVLLDKIGLDMSASFQDVAWNLIDTVVNGSGTGEVSLPQLEAMASTYTTYFNRSPAENFVLQIVSGTKSVLTDALSYFVFGKTNFTFEVRSWGTSGYKRIYCPELDIFVTSSTGRYAYANEAHLETSGGAKWVTLSIMADRDTHYHVLSELQLRNTATELGYKPIKYAGYWIIKKTNASGTTELVYADAEGRPYVAQYNASEWATSTDRPTTSVKNEDGNEVDDAVTGESTSIDLSGMTVTLPDGTFNFIDQLIYDESTKTYYIDSHDTYTTNNNYYVTNNYSWTYYINYTSITYIGQTAEYDKYYEVYYELPDGRDSADLTKEEVEQLNVSVDVIPYARGADDTSLRSLYHFDGDTRDSSYWNYCTDFTWNKGASLTYMDAGTFNGALYLDETEHDFTLTLPSSIGAGDFTLQFRYYQSHTEAPQTDSYIKLGDFTAMKLNGSSFVAFDDTVLAATPIGSWNEIALIRTDGTLYYYLNGVSIGNVSFNYGLGKTVVFHFGADQQTYKYFDELRVLNYALASDGENYVCTAVPHDTNLTLILPTDSVAVADEYWSISSSKENLLSAMGYDSWSGLSDPFSAFDATFTFKSAGRWNSVSADGFGVPAGLPRYPYFYYYRGLTSVCSYDNYMSIVTNELLDSTGTTNVPLNYIKTSSSCYFTPTGGINSLLGINSKGTTTLGLSSGTYTFSMVDLDGNVGSLTFTVPDSIYAYGGNSLVSSTTRASMEFNGCLISVWVMDFSNTTSSALYLSIQPTEYGAERCFTYLELVEGNSTDLSAEWVESVTVMDKADLNTPTLAVRTDLDITSYQIGGVRPSLPTKGQVWCLVENERITSIQIYNGSAWEGVDGRIWTGERWIPASSYNIITLQDMYDIADATQDFEYIYSESGFWTWWQKSWNAFTEKLFSVLGSGGSGTAGSSGTIGEDDFVADPDTEDEESWNIIELFVVLKDGTWKIIKGVVSTAYDGFSGFVSSVDSAGSFFDSYDTDSEEGIFYIPLDEGETIWD